MNTEILLERTTNKKYIIQRYLNFIKSRKNVKITGYHAHHILPKAIDFYPEYKNLKEHQWNCVFLSPREHYIAHWMLAVAFPKSTQSLAFYRMSNMISKFSSKQYEISKKEHIEKLKLMTQSPERNSKISKALSGVPKSAEHRLKLGGPRTDAEKLAISAGVRNSGFIYSTEQILRMSERRKGIAPKIGKEGIRKMTESKTKFLLKTPLGIFKTFFEASEAYGVNINFIFNRNRNGKDSIHAIPFKKVSLRVLGIENIEKLSWFQLGFDKLPKE